MACSEQLLPRRKSKAFKSSLKTLIVISSAVSLNDGSGVREH